MGNLFLEQLSNAIDNKNEDMAFELIKSNTGTYVTLDDIITFSQKFDKNIKRRLQGSVNINGSGGSGIIKPNLSSITAMYIACISNIRIAKTGSVACTGKWGSSDFFKELGLLNERNREYVWDKYGFAYYDYLEVSPWKKYKSALSQNTYLGDIFKKVVFFEYPTSYYFLGISLPRYHDSLLRLELVNRPDKLVTFYTESVNGIIDEFAAGSIFVQKKKMLQTLGILPSLNSTSDIKAINRDLVLGEGNTIWKECLENGCAIILKELGVVSSLDEGKDLFCKAWKDKVILNILKEIEL